MLERNGEVVARARTQAGNLAHAIKTPLVLMAKAADSARRHPDELAALPALVAEQVELALQAPPEAAQRLKSDARRVLQVLGGQLGFESGGNHSTLVSIELPRHRRSGLGRSSPGRR